MADNSLYGLLSTAPPQDVMTALAIENIKPTESGFISAAEYGGLKVTILKEDGYLYLGAINTQICEWLRSTDYCDGDEPSEFESRFFERFKNEPIGKAIQVNGKPFKLDKLQSQISLTTMYTDQDIIATMQIELGRYVDSGSVVHGLLRELITAAMFTYGWLHKQYTLHQVETTQLEN